MTENKIIIQVEKIAPEKRDRKLSMMADTFKEVYGGEDDGRVAIGEKAAWSVHVTDEELSELMNNPPSNLLSVEENKVDSVADAEEPDTVLIPEMVETEYMHNRALYKRARKTGRLSRYLVAVLDTGLDASFPRMNLVDGSRSFVPGEPPLETTHYHGSHVAGLACPPPARLLIAKCLGNSGSGDRDQIAAAIHWAIDRGADAINMSLSGAGGASPVYASALQRAADNGIAVWCAAGNTGIDEERQPAADPNAHAIINFHRAADDRHDSSTFGAHCLGSASGTNILSYGLNGSLLRATGTSMASPIACAMEISLMAVFGRYVNTERAYRVAGHRSVANVPRKQQGVGLLDNELAAEWLTNNTQS